MHGTTIGWCFAGALSVSSALPAESQQATGKPALTHAVYSHFNSSIDPNGAVSPDGKYLAYSYTSGDGLARMLVVESTDGKYKQEFPGGRQATFTADSRRAVVQLSDGTSLLELATRKLTPATGTVSRSGRWLAVQQDTVLVLTDLYTGRDRRFGISGGGDRTFVPSETGLVVTTADSLVRIDLGTGRMSTVYRGAAAGDLAFDTTGTRVAFVTEDSAGRVLRLYEVGMDGARVHVRAQSLGMRPGATIAADAPWFSADGTQLYFRAVEPKPAPVPDSSIIAKTVDVWNYRDALLQSAQLEEVKGPSLMRNAGYMAVVPVAGGVVIPLESRDTVVTGTAGNRYVLMKRVVKDNEAYWNADHRSSFALVSLRDGRRTHLDFQGAWESFLSPDEQFVVAFDPVRLQYVSYEVATGTTRALTKDMPVSFNRSAAESSRPESLQFPYGNPFWYAGDRAVLLYDRYDIWQVDPRARVAPICLTAGYGRRHGIVFRVEQGGASDGQIRANDVLLLKGVDEQTVEQGYWTIRAGQSAAPVLGSMESAVFGVGPSGGYMTYPPVKARDASVYLITRQTERDAPNWFVTTDLKSYRRLTNVQPQAEYNWLTSELITWTLPDGQRQKGILYKPENFDATKKYPVLFEFYEKRSSELRLFRKPALSAGRINIPWYVSNGYLVVVPDIEYRTGHPARSIVNTLESAANYLATFSWVDSGRMGVQGHSFGGYEAMVLATMSHRFAAANAAAGISDLVSKYGTPAYGENDNTWQVERQIFRMGTTPWDSPDLYIENSPVFYADSVTTPLLLMHNNKDDNVRIGQAIEMFVALRRLQKPVWLLQYDGEDHGVRGDASRDYTIRQQQFFDHYLKGAPAPVWMTQGIPAAAKGAVSGLELDTTGRKP